MGLVRHTSPTTTGAVHRAIQHSQKNLWTLAKCYGIKSRTVAKWKNQAFTADRRVGPTELSSTVLSAEDETVIITFRRHTILPLDECLYVLRTTSPHLTRSSLHRCLQRHRISRLPEVDGNKSKRSRFELHPIGYFHIDIAEA